MMPSQGTIWHSKRSIWKDTEFVIDLKSTTTWHNTKVHRGYPKKAETAVGRRCLSTSEASDAGLRQTPNLLDRAEF